MKDKPRHIRERFHDCDHIFDVLMAEDPEFRDLCEDHDACVDALGYWSKSKAPEARTRVNEYRNLVQELENEIYQTLSAKK